MKRSSLPGLNVSADYRDRPDVRVSDEAWPSGFRGTLSSAGRCLAEEDRRFGAAGLQSRPPQDAFVDVVQGDPEREGVPPFSVRNGGALQNDVPVGEAESAPEELAAGCPAARRAGAEQEIAANALGRRPGEYTVTRRLLCREGPDDGFNLLGQ